MREIHRGGRSRGLAAMSVIPLLAACAGLSAAPRIVVDHPVYDFGTVPNDSQVLHDFAIRNAGDAPLEISRVVSSCGACLQAGVEKSVIPPGTEGVLHAKLDSRLLRGPVSRAVMLYCNDPRSESVSVELTGVVMPYYELTPPEIDIDLSQGQQSADIEIAPSVILRAPLSQVVCNNPGLAAKVSREGADRFLLTVRVLESFPRGNAAVGVTVSSADPLDPPCHLACYIHNPPDLELVPDQLKFQPQAQPQLRILWLKQHGSSPLTLLDAVPPSGNFRCEIDPDPLGTDYRIYVTAWGQDAAGARAGVLTLKLMDQDQKERTVTVPISVN